MGTVGCARPTMVAHTRHRSVSCTRNAHQRVSDVGPATTMSHFHDLTVGKVKYAFGIQPGYSGITVWPTTYLPCVTELLLRCSESCSEHHFSLRCLAMHA